MFTRRERVQGFPGAIFAMAGGDPRSASIDDTGAVWADVMLFGSFALTHGLGGVAAMFLRRDPPAQPSASIAL